MKSKKTNMKTTESDTILKKSEKELETFLIENINVISENCRWGDILRIERQFIIPLKQGRIIIDLMIWHKDGTGTCIEVKTGNNNRNDDLTAIGQLLFYGTIIEHSLGCMPRFVVVSPKIKEEFITIIRKFNIPINVLELTDDRCIYLGYGAK